MNRVRRIALTTGIVAMLSAGAVSLFAQAGQGRGAGPLGPGVGPGGRGGFGAGFALGQLNLSDAQKQQVRDIMQRDRDNMRTTMQRLQQAMQAQRAAINQVPVNEQAVRAAAAGLAAVEADVAVAQARLHADIWNILTPEQQEKEKQLEQQAQARARERQQRAPRQPKQPV
jgi:Spy/CpxP family protein refolding chaperone